MRDRGRLGFGDGTHAWLCHSKGRIAALPFNPQYVNTHNPVSCLRQSRRSQRTDVETEAPREDRLPQSLGGEALLGLAGLRGQQGGHPTSHCGQAQGTQTPQEGCSSPPSLSVQGHVSWLGDTDSKHPPVCVGGKHRCLGTGMRTMGQQISDDLRARATAVPRHPAQAIAKAYVIPGHWASSSPAGLRVTVSLCPSRS